ncbi:MAG: oxaloacetate decarboxylase, partial [Tannerellaceae bacterium]|nr:oxaloacetate decarboxylase [Tannerellaceae bacterium]
SKGLITLVNKYAPEEIVQQKQIKAVSNAANEIPQATTAAIVSAISIVTGGKGKVTKIEKF